ncbi:hypothetical protein [Patulibacter americanus]|uniref:hypothetical protein n=1 Tax=Patulibacter americanus TaxID=588672 RepID=UPI00040974AE|nr:hypothetical protein [Patulibacter americanus]
MLGLGLLRPVRTARRCAGRLALLAVLVVVGATLLGGKLGPLDVGGLTTGALADRALDAGRDVLGTEDRGGGRGRDGRGTSADPEGCRRVDRVVSVGLSSTRYPEVRSHWEAAIERGRPRVLTVHRAGAASRRARLLRGIPTRPGLDRDEYPMAMARTTVSADVAYVDAAQNRGSGSVQGAKLRRYCSGQRFRVVWY